MGQYRLREATLKYHKYCKQTILTPGLLNDMQSVDGNAPQTGRRSLEQCMAEVVCPQITP